MAQCNQGLHLLQGIFLPADIVMMQCIKFLVLTCQWQYRPKQQRPQPTSSPFGNGGLSFVAAGTVFPQIQSGQFNDLLWMVKTCDITNLGKKSSYGFDTNTFYFNDIHCTRYFEYQCLHFFFDFIQNSSEFPVLL